MDYMAWTVRWKLEDGKRIKKVAEELGLRVPQLIRACVDAELARKTGDPAAIEALASMFREGVDEWIRSRVEYEVAKKKKEYEKKRA